MSGRGVERYYERNTRRFLLFGGGSRSGSIHRQLWGPGVTDTAAAANHINERLAAALRAEPVATVIDLGCGVGGTAVHVASALPDVRVTGITISATQAALARDLAERSGVGARCDFRQADFDSVRLDIVADAAVAIEAFVHSAEPPAFFATAARHLRAGGLLHVIDDFLVAGDEDRVARLLAERFRRGWRAPAFTSVASCAALAAGAGFELIGEQDLTPLIRLDRLRDRLIAVTAPPADRLGLAVSPFFGNLIGGNALRRGLREQRFAYRWLSFRRQRA